MANSEIEGGEMNLVNISDNKRKKEKEARMVKMGILEKSGSAASFRDRVNRFRKNNGMVEMKKGDFSR